MFCWRKAPLWNQSSPRQPSTMGFMGTEIFERGMRMQQRHEGQESVVGNSEDADLAVGFRHVLHQPIDGVVGVGGIVGLRGIERRARPAAGSSCKCPWSRTCRARPARRGCSRPPRWCRRHCRNRPASARDGRSACARSGPRRCRACGSAGWVHACAARDQDDSTTVAMPQAMPMVVIAVRRRLKASASQAWPRKSLST